MKRIVLLCLSFLLLIASAAHAASVAYIADGEVWLASLDGSQRVRLAEPVLNSSGVLEKWNAVAQADNGRIVATRNDPAKISSLSSFQVWEANGLKTIQGPLNRTGSYALPVYPLGFDVTADGSVMVYGFSNSSCCPYTLETGTYARPVTNSVLEPIRIGGQEDPTLFGARVVAHTGSTVNVQNANASTYGSAFTGWLDTSGSGLDIRRTDVAANGALIALELEEWTSGTQTTGKIALVATQGVDQGPTGAVDCYVPANGVAVDASLSQDATRVAWSDADGLKVAGTPTTAADPCVLTSAPVVIAPNGKSASIGAANVASFLPPPPAPPAPPAPPTPPSGPGTTTTPTAAPTATVPTKVTRAALTKGLAFKVQAVAAGKVTLTATVPAKALGKKGKPIVIATGSGTAKAAGALSIKLKLNATGRKQSKRLKGKKATLRVAQGTRSTTKTITLR
ncbi:hypothetical protein OJ997_35330 [Solirubrobacter phytolaccae]|uniref:Uncharacterized protein n=1 Tax=Solirubrobacter phytolaccae TaxID=1404360 RepID=A0A9X3NIB2_9ACTN|nr:hypothetical protein [Solirubrobacter phytolaccae]MDA0185632.1 hypothetical protein [Solirubrobacter phytolaccae]